MASIVIDHEAYGCRTEFDGASVDAAVAAAEEALHDCEWPDAAEIRLTACNDGRIINQDGENVGEIISC